MSAETRIQNAERQRTRAEAVTRYIREQGIALPDGLLARAIHNCGWILADPVSLSGEGDSTS